MSNKVDLQWELYEIGLFTSKDTLTNIKRLHSLVLTDKNINVAKLNDFELRKNLTQHGLLVGPVTTQTRSIYQRKLLEVLTNKTIEREEYEVNENILYPNFYDKNSFPYGIRKTYDGSKILRNDYRAVSSRDTLIRNNYEDGNLYDKSNIIRSRISTKSIKINQNPTLKKVNDDDKVQVTTKNSNGGNTIFYASITIIVALIVFILYLFPYKMTYECLMYF